MAKIFSFYDVFRMMYINNVMAKHANNPAWKTAKQTVENLGGENAIEETYSLWTCVSSEGQKRCLGFNSDDVHFKQIVLNGHFSKA